MKYFHDIVTVIWAVYASLCFGYFLYLVIHVLNVLAKKLTKHKDCIVFPDKIIYTENLNAIYEKEESKIVFEYKSTFITATYANKDSRDKVFAAIRKGINKK